MRCNIEAGRMYVWSVIARNDAGERAGPIWHFLTSAGQTGDPGGPEPGDDDDDHDPDSGPTGPQTSTATLLLTGSGCLKKLEYDDRGVSSTGHGTLGISADGNWIAFPTRDALIAGDSNSVTDIYVANLSSGAVQRVNIRSDGSQASAGCDWPHISDDGRFVLFTTRASLDSADSDNFDDVYLHDRATHNTQLVSSDVTTSGA
ncbi:MAG: TolB family protein [Phycisphaerae bacterium]